jgi:general secretion pathway protein G
MRFDAIKIKILLNIAKQKKPAGYGLRATTSAGFTILELVIVMTIIVILAAIGVLNYQRLQQHARETALKSNLRDMRRCIDQFAADKEALPRALEDLVSAGYIREIPTDPITGEKDWKVEEDEDTISREGGQGIVDVFSAAGGEGSDGKAYSDY